MRNVRTKIEGLSSRSTVTMTVLKRDIAEVLSRCCVYFAARKRKRSWLHMAANNISRIGPHAFPKFVRSLPHDWPGHYAYIAHTRILMN